VQEIRRHDYSEHESHAFATLVTATAESYRRLLHSIDEESRRAPTGVKLLPEVANALAVLRLGKVVEVCNKVGVGCWRSFELGRIGGEGFREMCP